MSYTIVWFRHDLRVHNHASLAYAVHRGKVLCLHVIELGLWAQSNAASQHYLSIQECLHDLAEQLRACGARLQVAMSEVTGVFGRLHAAVASSHLVSHEEAGDGHTFTRNKAVTRWCLDHDVTQREWPQHDVVRCLPTRNVWHDRWAEHMYMPCMPAPGVGALSGVMLPWPAVD